MRQLTILTAALLPLSSFAVYADGLIYRLPGDGVSALYKAEMAMEQNGTPVAANGTLSVSSVGQTTVDDEQCRWIQFELKMDYNGREQDVISTVLIPEKHLAKGKAPIDHVRKFWLKEGEGEASQVEDAKGPKGGPLPVFLSGPMKQTSNLNPEDVESPLGKLSCEGVAGRLDVKQGENDIEVHVKTRMHDKAPFGIVACEMKVKVSRDGDTRQNISMKLHLAEVGENAKSTLPNLE